MMVKTDNHNAEAKLELRRHFLRKYHGAEPPRVLDCCQGGGVLWGQLRKEFTLGSYWGLDLKAKKGRLKLASERVLAQAGWTQNVIDVDTYGSPWKHWAAILKNGQPPLTVFLTRGSHSLDICDAYEKAAIGMTFSKQIPIAFWPKIQQMDFAIRCCVLRVCGDIIITEMVEAVSDGNARYIGVRLEPTKTPAAQIETAKRAKPAKAARSKRNV